MIVDEAQSIEDADRGGLLASVLSDIHNASNESQFIFSMPFVRNPEVLGTLVGLPRSSLKPVKTSQQQVAQNYFVTHTIGKKIQVELTDRSGARSRIAEISIARSPGTVNYRRLATCAAALGSKSTLVYAPGPQAAENTAAALSEVLATNTADDKLMADRRDLAQFLRDHIHAEYIVAETVLNGVGCHYGPMPALARLGMERAFKDGILNFLTTTATLLYGVNLPARDIFVLSPKKGPNDLSPLEFWNLIGRAGRLSKELDGNVFLVDYDNWDTQYLLEARERDITPAATADVRERGAAFADYIIESKARTASQQPGFDGSMIRLIAALRAGTLVEALYRLDADPKTLLRIEDNLKLASESIPLPIEVLASSPNVNPYRQIDLFRDLVGRSATREDALDLLPKHPLKRGAKERLRDILQTCMTCIEGQDNRTHVYLTAISYEWMRGSPLPAMIDTAHTIALRKKPGQDISTTIRNVLVSIEKDIGYRCVRDIGCYNRILKYVLQERYPDLADGIVDIPLFLEFGASSSTMIACMTLGLSRISAVKVASLLADANLNSSEVLGRLRAIDISRVNFASIILSEIEDALLRNSRGATT